MPLLQRIGVIDGIGLQGQATGKSGWRKFKANRYQWSIDIVVRLHLNKVLTILRRRIGQIGQDNHERPTIRTDFLRIDDFDPRRRRHREGPNQSFGPEISGAFAIQNDFNAVQPIILPVVHIGQIKVQGVEAVLEPNRVAITTLRNAAGRTTRLIVLQTDGELINNLLVTESIAQTGGEIHLHPVTWSDDIAILLRKGHKHAHIRSTRLHGAGQGREVTLDIGHACCPIGAGNRTKLE